MEDPIKIELNDSFRRFETIQRDLNKVSDTWKNNFQMIRPDLFEDIINSCPSDGNSGRNDINNLDPHKQDKYFVSEGQESDINSNFTFQ